MAPRIMIIDDEVKMCSILKRALKDEGYDIDISSNPVEAISMAESSKYDIILCDLKMPEMSGIEVLEKMKQIQPDIDFIIMTAYSTVQTAVESMKMGAVDYLIKPFSIDEVKIIIKRLLETMEIKEENIFLKEALHDKFKLENFIAKSKSMESVIEKIKKVSRTNASVLLRGESGTGKEVLAKCIHYNSPRNEKPMIRVNCGAFVDTLLESELFGYIKGAFTGANETRKGLFESADKGTIFLDEIGDVPPSLQVKLLRVLQEGEFQRVGNLSETIKVDVRIIAATNKNIEEEVKNGKFREDLYFRLNVVPIVIPPLRERRDDIQPLINFFLQKYTPGDESINIENDVIQVLYNYDYPGNIRELENAVEHAVVMCDNNIIALKDLPANIQEFSASIGINKTHIIPDSLTIDEMEKKMIMNAMSKTGCNHTKAAALLGITRRTLGYRVSKYQLEQPIIDLKEELRKNRK